MKLFSELSLEDEFFNSLRESYAGFDDWFRRKAIEGARALTYFEDGKLKDFLYLKNENEALSDVCPNLPPKRRLKVGTFKIDNRGTKRGERFLKKVFDKAIADDAEEIYVTIFPEKRLQPLIRLFETYGFHKVAIKKHKNGNEEDVLVRDMKIILLICCLIILMSIVELAKNMFCQFIRNIILRCFLTRYWLPKISLTL